MKIKRSEKKRNKILRKTKFIYFKNKVYKVL